MWARIENGVVAEMTGQNPSGRFHPSLKWVECDGAAAKVGWLFAGGVFAPPDPPSPSEIAKEYELKTQILLDSTARSRGYDSINTAVSYAEEPAVIRFQQDGQAFRAWRSLVWDYAHTQLALVQDGKREQPTVEQFLSELPAFLG